MHPAFNKGAKLMDLEVRRVPVGADFRADLAALEAAIDADTIMLVGSAPNFPYGMHRPDRRARPARRATAMSGCMSMPASAATSRRSSSRSAARSPISISRCRRVASLSADLHKFGFCPKPASTVFYRDADKAQHHHFDSDVWPNGRFLTGTLVGTRPAGGVAGAWATFQYPRRRGLPRDRRAS